MRTKLTLALLLVASVAGAAEIRGTWSALARGDRMQLSITRPDSNWSRTVPRSDFALTDAQINAATETPVHFTLARDAGTVEYTGTFQSGSGVGRFVFVPSSSYEATLRSLGVSSEEPLDEDMLFRLAMFDISTAFIREMQQLGIRESLETYIRFRIHGVTTEFVRGLQNLGYSVSGEDLVRFRIHGVTPEFATTMHDLGVRELTAENLVRMRIHGVSTDFVRGLRDLGYNSGVSAEDLVRMRIHDVTLDFIRGLADAGYHGIPPDKLVQMRIRGVTAQMLKANQ